MGKAKTIKSAEVVTTSQALPESGMVWIIKNSGKESYVSVQLAKTLIDKKFAKLKES